MNDTAWLAIIIGGGALIFVAMEFIKDWRTMRKRTERIKKQKEMKKRLIAKFSKRLYKEKKK